MKALSCAIYTRKSSEEGLEQDFNSLHAQREACAAFIQSQKAEGWQALPDAYDDGGYSGGTLERPALKRLMQDIAARRVQVIVVYKVDRLTRSLADFAKLVEQFDAQGVCFVSVTQQFSTTSSMGRLTLNVLLSFAQFEREVTSERIRDKIAASKKKGMWMGGIVPMGYRAHERTLVIDGPQAERIRSIYQRYLELGTVRELKEQLDGLGWVTPPRKCAPDRALGGRAFSRGHLYRILSNPIYLGQIAHKGQCHAGQHPAIVSQKLWDQVQASLASNRRGHRQRTGAKIPSLLAGRVFDSAGQPLSSTHACKGTRRYRYYVSQNLVGKVKPSAPHANAVGLRIPAAELEALVRQVLTQYLGDPHRILADLGQPDAATYKAITLQAKQMADTLMHGRMGEQITLIDLLIERVTVSCDRVEVRLTQSAWGESSQKVTPLVLSLAVRLQRCGFGVRLIVPAQDGPQRAIVDSRLVKFVHRGIGWFRQVVSQGRGPSEIAKAEGVSPSLVQRLMYVALLAPDIVAAIEAGKQPVSLTPDSLLKALPLPASWQRQRQVLGIETSMK